MVGRLLWELRFRLPMISALVLLWGFALIALFSSADGQTRSAGLDGNVAIAFRLAGLNPLTTWTSLGQVHPIFLVAAFLFAIGLGARAVAGELESGGLDLVLARAVSRRRYLASHVAVLVPGAALLAVGYAAGAVVADRIFDPPGGPLGILRMAMAAGQAWLLFLAIGALAMCISTLTSERSRALTTTVAIVLGMYVGNFLFALWTPLEALTYGTLFHYFNPGPTIQFGDVAWRDSGVLVGFAIVMLAAAFAIFSRRDLAR